MHLFSLPLIEKKKGLFFSPTTPTPSPLKKTKKLTNHPFKYFALKKYDLSHHLFKKKTHPFSQKKKNLNKTLASHPAPPPLPLHLHPVTRSTTQITKTYIFLLLN